MIPNSSRSTAEWLKKKIIQVLQCVIATLSTNAVVEPISELCINKRPQSLNELKQHHKKTVSESLHNDVRD